MRVPYIIFSLLIATPICAQWTTPKPVDTLGPGGQYGPLIAVSKQGHIAIACRTGPYTTGHYTVFHSTDRGKTFARRDYPPPVQLGPPPSYYYNLYTPAGLAYDTNNTLWLLWQYELYYDGVFQGEWLQLMTSVSDGDSFTTFWQTVKDIGLYRPRLLVDNKNNVHILCDTTISGGQQRLEYLRFNTGSFSDRSLSLLPLPDSVHQFPFLADFAIQDSNIVHVVVEMDDFEQGREVDRIEYTRSVNSGGSFSPYVPLDTVSGLLQHLPSIALTAQHQLMISYYTETTGELQYGVYSNNQGVTFSDPFIFGSRQPGGSGVMRSDSSFLLLVYNSPYGTMYNKFTEVNLPAVDSTFFDSLLATDLQVGDRGEKYLVFQRYTVDQNSPVYLSLRDFPEDVKEDIGRRSSSFSISVAPNPFTSTTTFFIDVQEVGKLDVEVFNMIGQLVSRINWDEVGPGIRPVRFTDNSLPSGAYMVRATSNGVSKISKFMLIR
jgi:hypothetical protein